MSEPVASLTLSIPRLDGLSVEHDEAAHAVHFRLAGETLGVGNRSAESAGTNIRHELRQDRGSHENGNLAQARQPSWHVGSYSPPVTRDPERIYAARRASIFRRLVDSERLNRFDAEQWIEAWEREAARTGVEAGGHGFWDAGWLWIENQRNEPKRDMSAEGDDGQVYEG